LGLYDSTNSLSAFVWVVIDVIIPLDLDCNSPNDVINQFNDASGKYLASTNEFINTSFIVTVKSFIASAIDLYCSR
jgi:hypothetical protein